MRERRNKIGCGGALKRKEGPGYILPVLVLESLFLSNTTLNHFVLFLVRVTFEGKKQTTGMTFYLNKSS